MHHSLYSLLSFVDVPYKSRSVDVRTSKADVLGCFGVEALKTKFKIKFMGAVVLELDYKNMRKIAQGVIDVIDASEESPVKVVNAFQESKALAEKQLYSEYCNAFKKKHHKLKYVKLKSFDDLSKDEASALKEVVKMLHGTGVSYEQYIQIQIDRLLIVKAFPTVKQLATSDAIRVFATKIHEADNPPETLPKTTNGKEVQKASLRENAEYGNICNKIRSGKFTRQDVLDAQRIHKSYTGSYNGKLNELLNGFRDE